MQIFGDGFDLYSASTDLLAGYWDPGSNAPAAIVSGRFSGSRAIQVGNAAIMQKSMASNDPVWHVSVAIYYNGVLGAAGNVGFISFCDGGTAQATIHFRGDGSVVLCNGYVNGPIISTYNGAVPAGNQWWQFEFEVVINGSTGSWAVRKGGSTSNDFSASGLNTRGGTSNNYANRIFLAQYSGTAITPSWDDLLVRSDPVSLPWLGDITCYTRMPASDVAVQFTPNSGTANFSRVNEAQEDGATSYVFDSTVGHNDLYSIAALSVTPATVIAVTTRGFMQKSDTGNRSAAVQLKSGSTTVNSGGAALQTTWAWNYRTDLTDPGSGGAWTAAAVNSLQIGPVVTA